MKKRPNVILITIDSLRADHCGFMGYEKNTTPNIDALAKESIVFTQAYSTAPMTAQSLISLLTSTYPLDYNGPRKIEKPRVLLSEVFKKEGYTTAVFTSNAYISNFFGYNRGWDFFEYLAPPFEIRKNRFQEKFKKIFKKISFNTFPQIFFWIKYLEYKKERKKPDFNEEKFWKGIPDFLIIHTFKEFVEAMKKKEFFAWIHCMGVHAPYLPFNQLLKRSCLSLSDIEILSLPGHFAAFPNKKPLRELVTKNLQKIKDFYNQAIQYTDFWIGSLLNFLREKKLYQETLIVLTSDHGEEFLEHGETNHPCQLYNELLHVPLLIKIPEKPPQKITKKVSLIDLAPTLCEVLNISPSSTFKGKSLFAPNSNPFLFHQTGFNEKKEGVFKYVEIEKITQCKVASQFQNWKYILDHGNGQEELYNLSKDPKEQNNIASKESKILVKMRKIVQEFEKQNPPLSLVNKSV